MNEQERAELERLKQTQSELLNRLSDLGRKIVAFEARVKESEAAEAAKLEVTPITAPTLKPEPLPDLKPLAPPIISTAVPATSYKPPTPPPAPVPAPIVPPPVPAVAAPAPVSFPSSLAPVSRPPAAPPKPKGSFEMQVGTYWLVRIGIVMVVTGLVFFGTFAYHNYVPRLTPGVKILLLYVASGALLGVGAWLQRGDEKIRNYAQVLMAGGLAAVYFTTYAAHHVERLQIIASATLDGGLLLAWATFIIWIADRKKSELIAFFAVLLAYYTAAITHIGLFTLYSNLLLAIAAVFFLVRNRWSVVSFASLSATYAGYAFWRFYNAGEWRLVSPDEGLWTGVYFLIAYWAIFTTAVFLSRHEQFAGQKRAAFLTLNNGAFFTTFLITMAQVHNDKFWQFSLITGATFTALAALSYRLLPKDRACSNTYLTQGVLLMTVGFIAHYTGLKLGLVLGVESFILVAVGQLMKSRVLQIGSVVVAFLAALRIISSTEPFDHQGMVAGFAVGALLLLNAFWLRRETTFDKSAIHPRTLCFTILSLATWLVTTWQNTRPEWRGFAIVAESVGFLFAAIPLANRVLIFGSYGFSAVGVIFQIFQLNDQLEIKELAQRLGLLPAVLLGALLVVNAVSEQQRLKEKNDEEYQIPVTYFSLTALLAWLMATFVFAPHEYLAPLLAAEAAVLTASFYVFRVREIALFGQGFLVCAQCYWLYDVLGQQAKWPWWNAASIIAMTLLLALWWQRQKSLTFKETYLIQLLQGAYALAVVGLTYYWLQPHFTPPQWIAFTSLLAIVATIYGAVTRQWLLAAFGQLFLVASAGQFAWQLWDGKPDWEFALVPMAAGCLLSFGAVKWLASHSETRAEIRDAVLQTALVYRCVAVAMTLWWLHEYIPAREQPWVAALAGLALFLTAGWRASQELLIFSGIFSGMAVARFLLPLHGAETVYLPNLLVILLIAAQQQLAHRAPKKYSLLPPIHIGTILIVGVCAWRLLTLWIVELGSAEGSYLTAGWSALAFVMFITGMTLREKVYRWIGLALLGCALGRVVIIDVWKLETLYRILSFLALGIVLLLLGFIYNKYQEKIREWL